jgi:UDP-N-acetylglucosamine acyltransferase
LIHSTVLIDPGARIGENVTIGPYSIVGPEVIIGDDTWIGPNVVIKGPTIIGKSNRIFQFSSIGDDPQDKKYSNDSNSVLEIGNNNVIREFCTINRGTNIGGGKTVIGNENWIMAYVHIAHDCNVGSHTVFANNTSLAGHVIVDDYAIFGGFSGVHQFCRIGKYCFTAISSIVVRDVPPFLMVAGNTAKPNGLNREGLKRHGFSNETINLLRKAYKIVYRQGLTLKLALTELGNLGQESEEVRYFSDFISKSTRGIVR